MSQQIFTSESISVELDLFTWNKFMEELVYWQQVYKELKAQ